jgi:hypothetical protein
MVNEPFGGSPICFLNIERAREARPADRPDSDSLQFLQSEDRNEVIPLGVRIRAAVEAAPFETPTLLGNRDHPRRGRFRRAAAAGDYSITPRAEAMFRPCAAIVAQFGRCLSAN